MDENKQFNCFGIVLNHYFLRMTLDYTNFNRVNLHGLITGKSEELKIQINDRILPCYSFAELKEIVKRNNIVFGLGIKYLIIGYGRHLEDQWHMAEILIKYGVPKENIINYTLWVNEQHLRLMKYALNVENGDLDFIATGISYMEAGLDVQRFGKWKGINLALSGQDLWYGYQIIKQVMLRRKLKFCLLGLSPYSFRYEISKSFSANFYAYHYYSFLQEFDKDFSQIEDVCKMVNDKFKTVWNNVGIATEEERQGICNVQNEQIMVCDDFCSYKDVLRSITKKYYPATIRKNTDVLRRCLELCHSNGVEPIIVVLPFARLLRENIDVMQLENFRLILSLICEKYQTKIIDLFDYELEDKCFVDMTHLNASGSKIISDVIYDELA